MKKALASLVFTIALCSGAKAAARDFLAYQSTTPILYRYAACALSTEEVSAEAQIEKCRQLRNNLEEEAGVALLRFHSGDRRKAELNLKRGFNEIDKDAERAREQRKTLPTSMAAYLRCMGERVMATEDYRLGVAVDYTIIEDQCAEEHVLSVSYVRTEQELERIKILYRRFARTGRYLDGSRLGSVVASTGNRGNTRLPSRRLSRSLQIPPFVVMTGSFLDLSQLPADELPE